VIMHLHAMMQLMVMMPANVVMSSNCDNVSKL